MDNSQHNRLVAFIWSIADDCLRDVYVRGKYRDVILPMTVLRRLDALLEPTKKAVLEAQKEQKKENYEDPQGLEDASGFQFYNTSQYTLKSLHASAVNDRQALLRDFEEYLNGFSENVREIIDKFKLRAQIRHMAAKDVLLSVLEKFTSAYINLTPFEVEDPDGHFLPALTNLGMGYVFEELIRKFNEENNEEAGEHFTPREVIDLMTHLIFEPIRDQLPPNMVIYDPACGSGGMLTESENFIKDPEGEIRYEGAVYLYGKEINDETYAICKSDMMIKGNNAKNIANGSTLAEKPFPGIFFDFMLSNPPYGKSWSSEVDHIKSGKDIIDRRFIVPLPNYWGESEEVPATPRTSDGQLLFLMEMVKRMKALTPKTIGSRIASVHNGSSLFTGDAGGGESNIRRYIIENDLLDAIIQLPNNLFYNTGITTYIWLLSNNKPAGRKGKVFLIDASQRFSKLRKNLGAKNCELRPEHIREILDAYHGFTEVERENADALAAQVFDNQDFGYYKVTIERPQRLKAQFTGERIAPLRFDRKFREVMEWAWNEWQDGIYEADFLEQQGGKLVEWCEENGERLGKKQKNQLLKQETWQKPKRLWEQADRMREMVGETEYNDFNAFQSEVNRRLKAEKMKWSAAEKKAILGAVSWYDAEAEKVIAKEKKISGDQLEELLLRLGCREKDLPDFGYYPGSKSGTFITYETASDLRDTENVPLKEEIHAYFRHEVQPHVAEAWIDLEKTKIGYEISFNKYFYQHTPLRELDEVEAEIRELERLSDGLIGEILGGAL